MIPSAFDYHAPGTIEEAVALLERHGDEAKVLSGGQSLLPLLKLRLGDAGHLVDIGRIPGLAGITEADGYLRIGGATREADLERSDLIRENYPILLDTAAVIADPLVRNRATVGGNLAHGDPANDHPATMLALEAEVVARGPDGERTIPITRFFTGLFATALAPAEILTEIRIPIPPPRSGGAYVKLERKVGDFATAAAAAQVTLGGQGEITRIGIGLTNAGPTPIKATAAEAYLLGRRPDAEAVAEAARLAADATSPSADRRGSVEYKRDMARVLTGPGDQQGGAAGGRAVGMATHDVRITVNGAPQAAAVESRLLLVHWLRDVLRLTGTHIGCDTTHCGACTVLLDGEPVKSCTVLAVQADGREVMTVEGLEQDGSLHPLQEGFHQEHGLQCGFCTPGMLMTGSALLQRTPNPSEAEIRQAISGNLCRCTGYVNIVKSIEYAAAKLG